MLLYVMRHGIAEDAAPSGADADRRLTDAGAKKTRRVLRALARRVDPPELILTSPLLRARQTAEIAAEVFKVNLDDWPVLGGNDAAAIMDVLGELSQVPVTMIVGHEPSLGDLVARLCHAPPGAIRMKKAGCAALDVPFEFGERTVDAATLRWLVTPGVVG